MKAKEMTSLSNEELIEKVKQFKEELFNLRFQASVHQLKNPMRIRTVRKIIARLYTVLNARKEVK